MFVHRVGLTPALLALAVALLAAVGERLKLLRGQGASFEEQLLPENLSLSLSEDQSGWGWALLAEGATLVVVDPDREEFHVLQEGTRRKSGEQKEVCPQAGVRRPIVGLAFAPDGRLWAAEGLSHLGAQRGRLWRRDAEGCTLVTSTQSKDQGETPWNLEPQARLDPLLNVGGVNVPGVGERSVVEGKNTNIARVANSAGTVGCWAPSRPTRSSHARTWSCGCAPSRPWSTARRSRDRGARQGRRGYAGTPAAIAGGAFRIRLDDVYALAC